MLPLCDNGQFCNMSKTCCSLSASDEHFAEASGLLACLRTSNHKQVLEQLSRPTKARACNMERQCSSIGLQNAFHEATCHEQSCSLAETDLCLVVQAQKKTVRDNDRIKGLPLDSSCMASEWQPHRCLRGKCAAIIARAQQQRARICTAQQLCKEDPRQAHQAMVQAASCNRKQTAAACCDHQRSQVRWCSSNRD